MKKLTGFTMAEVLITLGIIGIVAAMTLPSVIKSYQKKVTVIRLKRTYNVLMQAFERSRADYGDPSNWGFDSVYNSDPTQKDAITEKFTTQYVVPYLPKIQKYQKGSFKDLGYKKEFISNGLGTDGVSLDNQGYLTVLNDGSILLFTVAGYNYGTSENPDVKLTNIYIIADINGLRGPNATGVDIFSFYFQTQPGKLSFYSYSGNNGSYNRSENLENCKKVAQTCGNVIMQDGWEIRNDYPWF